MCVCVCVSVVGEACICSGGQPAPGGVVKGLAWGVLAVVVVVSGLVLAAVSLVTCVPLWESACKVSVW